MALDDKNDGKEDGGSRDDKGFIEEREYDFGSEGDEFWMISLGGN